MCWKNRLLGIARMIVGIVTRNSIIRGGVRGGNSGLLILARWKGVVYTV